VHENALQTEGKTRGIESISDAGGQ